MSLRNKVIAAVATALVEELADKGFVLCSAQADGTNICLSTASAVVKLVRDYDCPTYLFFAKGTHYDYVKIVTDGGRAPVEMIGDWAYWPDNATGRNFNRIMQRFLKKVDKAALVFDFQVRS